MRIHPFVAERPPPELAGAVASLPYDVVSSAQARALTANNPNSFLRVVRPEVDLPEGTDPAEDRVYAQGASNLQAFRREGLLRREDGPGLFAYRLVDGTHAQTGIVATCHIDDYLENRIRKHELTLPAKEADRTRHIDTLNANTGPVFLTYRDRTEIAAMTEAVEAQPPVTDFTAVDGVRHTVWRILDPAPWLDAFAEVPAAYVADGHHRAASAVRVGAQRRQAQARPGGEAPYHRFLCVLFPAGQLRILPYNRVVSDLHGRNPEGFLVALAETGCRVATDPGGGQGPRPGEILCYLAGAWHRLSWPGHPPADPVERLDVSLLQDRILTPLLGIENPRTSDRIQFVGGVHGAQALTGAVDSGEFAAAFSLYPTGIDQVMDIADAGRILPAKSTWFEPKLRSGLFVYSLEARGHEPADA